MTLICIFDCQIDGVGHFSAGQKVEGEQATKVQQSTGWADCFITEDKKPARKK